MYHDYETIHHNVWDSMYIPHSHTAKSQEMYYISHTHASQYITKQITAKLNTHTKIGFVNNIKRLFLNGYSSTCLVENCYVGLCRCVETSCGFEVFHLFFL